MEDNINMDFQDVAWEYGLNCSGLGEGQVVGFVSVVMNRWVL